MTRIISIGGVVTDWSPDNQSGDYAAWLDAPFSQPPLETIGVNRDGTWPVGTAVQRTVYMLPPIHIQIMDKANEATLRPALLAALDTSGGFKALIVADDGGSNERFWMCNFRTREERDEARGTGLAFVVTAEVVDDPYPRRTAASVAAASLTASGQTLEIVNEGHVDAFATVEIEPTVGRSGDGHWKHRRFVVARWRTPLGASNHPVRVSGDDQPWDTTALTPTKAVDESSVGVLVDGAEVSRWFAPLVEDYEERSFDNTDTALWVNLDFQSGLEATLAAGMGSLAGAVAGGIRVNEDISAFPPAGILYAPAEDELFVYVSRDVKRRTFHGVTRAAYGSAASMHSAGAALEWIQHEIFIVYSPETGLTMAADDRYRPLVELYASDNGRWDWNLAYPSGLGSELNRSGGWQPATAGAGEIFTGYQRGVDVEPFEVLGISNDTPGNENMALWQAYFPSAIRSAFLDAQAYETTPVGALRFDVSIDGANWKTIARRPGEGAAGDVWLNADVTLLNQTMGWRYARFAVIGEVGSGQIYQGSVAFDSDLKPVVQLMSETTNYALDMTITNETTGEGIELDHPAGLSVGDKVVVNSGAKTVVAEPFGRNIYRVMTKSSHRRVMLRLAPGVNVLRVDEAGLAGVELVVTWQEGFYS